MRAGARGVLRFFRRRRAKRHLPLAPAPDPWPLLPAASFPWPPAPPAPASPAHGCTIEERCFSEDSFSAPCAFCRRPAHGPDGRRPFGHGAEGVGPPARRQVRGARSPVHAGDAEGLSGGGLAKLGEQIQSFGAVGRSTSRRFRRRARTRSPSSRCTSKSRISTSRFIVNQAGLVAGMFLLPGESLRGSRPPTASRIRSPSARSPSAPTSGSSPARSPSRPARDHFPASCWSTRPARTTATRPPAAPKSSATSPKASPPAASWCCATRSALAVRQQDGGPAWQDRARGDRRKTPSARRPAADAERRSIRKRVYVLGHGLGGYVAPRIAEEDGKVAGLILLAANARPLEDLIVEQAEYLGAAGQGSGRHPGGGQARKVLEPGDADAPPSCSACRSRTCST